MIKFIEKKTKINQKFSYLNPNSIVNHKVFSKNISTA